MKELIIARLNAGEIIEGYTEAGNSMLPLIASKQPVTLAPVDVDKLEEGDIVLCKVKGKYYTHLVKATRVDGVLIGNNRGHINGWASRNNVYGIVTHIDGVERRHAKDKVRGLN